MPAFRCRGRIWHNPVLLALDSIGGMWRMPILWRLKDGPMRYGELKRSLSKSLGSREITDRALAVPLRRLERDRLLTREVRPGRPPAVAYAITERGLAAIDCIRALQRYGLQLKAWEGGVEVPDPVAPLKAAR
jgi:DNA-binding HxlR family transcriptional regulator